MKSLADPARPAAGTLRLSRFQIKGRGNAQLAIAGLRAFSRSDTQSGRDTQEPQSYLQ